MLTYRSCKVKENVKGAREVIFEMMLIEVIIVMVAHDVHAIYT